MLLEIKNGTVSRGGNIILDHFDFHIRGTEKIALIGRNGAGKTTLLEVLAGYRSLERDPKYSDSGMKCARKISTGMLSQQSAVRDPGQRVRDLFLKVLMQDRTEEFRYSRERFEAEQQLYRTFTQLGFKKSDADREIGSFSGGERMKILLMELFAQQPDVLILDEPTNYLDFLATYILEQKIKTYPKAVVITSHDRYFIDQTASVTWEISQKKLFCYAGNYSAYRQQKTASYNKQQKAYEAQQKEIQHLRELTEKFKHKPRKASFARSRVKMLERMEKINPPIPDDAVIHTGDIVPARPGNKVVFTCEHLKTGYDTVLHEISLRIRRGQKIGIFGANGSGKTAFLKTVAGLIPPISGKMELGDTIDLAYFDQLSADISSEDTVFQWFEKRFPDLPKKEIRSWLAQFLFRNHDFGKKVSELSGGEKSRLVLARIFLEKPNFILMDEPTNHMDIPARETLESIFRDYTGTILFVSHDRYFLTHTARSLLIFSDESQVLYYPFGYEHYEKSRQHHSETIARTTEEQKMLDDFRAVPEKERHQLREISTEQAYWNWRFRLNKEEREQAEKQFGLAYEKNSDAQADIKTLDQWMQAEQKNNEKTEEKRDAWTKSCLDWYDLWLEYKNVTE